MFEFCSLCSVYVKLHALSPPLAARYALDTVEWEIIKFHQYSIVMKIDYFSTLNKKTMW